MSAQTSFSNRLRRVVDRAGGVNAVAAAVGVSPDAVYGWLGGAQPYRRTVLKLCTKLGIAEEWLLHGNGDEEPAAHAQHGARESHRVSESEGETHAQDLAEMIHELAVTPRAFLAVAIARVREQFDEFIRRAEMRAADIHRALPHHDPQPVRYTSEKQTRKKSKP